MLSLRSQLRRKLLTHFYVNRSSRVYVRQLARRLGVDSTNLSRELLRLEREGLLKSEIDGRQTYYSLNLQYPYLRPLFTLLQGTIGIEPSIRNALENICGIDLAFLYGSFAKDEADAVSDIDLLIVGKPHGTGLAAEISRLEKLLKREISYTVLSQQELNLRLAAHDVFLTDIWKGKRISLIDHEQNKTTKD
jgi:predicted nucleotidyltransferase